MPNNKNLDLVAKLKDKIAKSKSVIFTEYHGLDVNQVNDLRSKIKDSGAEMVVAKNTLLKIALNDENLGGDEVDKQLSGPTASVFSYEDAISPLKTLVEFAKDTELPKLKGGLVEGVFNNATQLETLSKLPSKQELLGQVVGALSSPITGFLNALNGKQRDFVYTLSAIADKKKAE